MRDDVFAVVESLLLETVMYRIRIDWKALLVGLLFSACALPAVAAPELRAGTTTAAPGVSAVVTADEPDVGADGLAAVIIELHGEPSARVYAREIARLGDSPSGRQFANNAARQQVQALKAAQVQTMETLRATGLRFDEIYRLQRVFNGVAVRAEPSAVAALRALPGVRRVDFMQPEYPTNSSSVPFVSAPPVWGNTLGLASAATGTGVKIGIIDSGIDYQHPAFGGTGLLADYQANNPAIITDGFYPTPKVAGGFDFVGDAYTGANTRVPDPDPMDCGGHGSHVAGIAAAFGVNADGSPFTGPFNASTDFAPMRIGPGVAPQAQLYSLRVFGCGGGTNVVGLAIEWATDPDDNGDFSDRLDVINMSLGSNYGSPSDTSTVASDNASAIGVIVVASAGNAGDTFFISGSPGVSGRTISVANVADSGIAGALINVNAPGAIAGGYPAAASAYTNPSLPNPPPPAGQTGNVVLVDDGSTVGPGTINDGCQTPFVNAAAVLGNVALIERGGCGFTIKAQNAQANGAIGVVIANNVAGDPVPIGMGGAAVGPPITIPGMSIAEPTSTLIRAQLLLGAVNVTFAAANAGDTISGSSSRGPRGGGEAVQLKPDLAAPGTLITSVQTGIVCTGIAPSTGCLVANPSGFIAGGQPLTISGTSMAAPHVAGYMALLRQLYPSRSVEELKALAMNRSSHRVTVGANASGATIPISRAGSGRIDVASGATGSIAAFNDEDEGLVSVSFDIEPVGASTSAQKSVRVVNRGSSAQTLNVGIVTQTDTPGVVFSIVGPGSITVPAGGSTTFNVRVDADATQIDRRREPSMSPVQNVAAPASLAGLGNVPRHYIAEESALIILSSGVSLMEGGETEVARVPVYAAVRPQATMSAASVITTGGAPSGSTTIVLSGTDVCTGTAGPGSCTGNFGTTDQVSLVGGFELQVTSPRNVSLPAFADIRYVGVGHDPAIGGAGGTYLFGLASWGEWGTLGNVAYNICVDNNEDGVYDRVLFNSDLGQMSRLVFGTPNVTGQDTFITGVFSLPPAAASVSTGGAAAFVNYVTAAAADTAVHGNEVFSMGATATQLGLTAVDTTFRYAVATCPGFNPLCVRANTCLSTGNIDLAAGPFFFNSAARGVTFGTPAGWQFDLSGTTLPVTWNTANMTTNGSVGGLLLHTHNSSGLRAQAVAMEGAATTDIAVALSANTGTPTPGQVVNFLVTATNNGAIPASATLSVPLAAGLTYQSDTAAGAYSPATGEWTVASITAGASASFTLSATVNTSAAITQTALVSTSLPVIDTVPGNDRTAVTINGDNSADLSLNVSANVASAYDGESVVFTLTLNNGGPDTAYSININEAFVGAGIEPLAPLSAVASEGVYSGATGLWQVPTRGDAVGGPATLVLTFAMPAGGADLTLQATASTSATVDANSANNSDSATVTGFPDAVFANGFE